MIGRGLRGFGFVVAGLALAPVVAVADDQALPGAGQTLVSAYGSGPGVSQLFTLSDGGPGVSVAALPSDGMTPGPPPPAATTNWYASWGATGQHFGLPGVSLGLSGVSSGALTNTGQAASFNRQAGGIGLDAAVGYLLPPNAVPPLIGANPRLELDLAYAHGSGHDQNSTPPTAFGMAGLLLDGTVSNNGPVCGAPAAFTCTQSSALSSQFTTWHLALKEASEFHLGMVMLTPSLSVVGGEGDDDFGLTQNLAQFAGGVFDGNTEFYSTSVRLHWRDIGAKGGLNLNVPVNNWLSLGLGASAAGVGRSASLAGSDLFALPTFGLAPPQVSPLISAVTRRASTAALMSNVEGSLNIVPLPGVTIRLFGGATYDDALPGVRSPTWTGPATAQTSGTPVAIKFVGRGSLYGGAGMVFHF